MDPKKYNKTTAKKGSGIITDVKPKKDPPVERQQEFQSALKDKQAIAPDADYTKQQVVAAANLMGVLPHEWLLGVMRGEPIRQSRTEDIKSPLGKVIGHKVITEEVYPDLETRIDAAKSIAPYFAPRLAATQIVVDDNVRLVKSLTDDELEQQLQGIMLGTILSLQNGNPVPQQQGADGNG